MQHLSSSNQWKDVVTQTYNSSVLYTIADDLKHFHGADRQDMAQAADQGISVPGAGALWTPWHVSGLC